MASSSQRASMMMKGSRKHVFDAAYIAEWLNASFPSLNVTADDVLKPTCDGICEIYMVITQHILKLPQAVLTMPPFDTNGEADAEMFTQAMPKIVVYKALSACIEDLTGEQVLTLSDMLSPTPRDTRRILSILIDFMQFREQISKEVDEVFAKHEERKMNLKQRQAAVEEQEHLIELRHAEQKRRKRDENEKRAELEHLCQEVQDHVDDNALLAERHQSGITEVNMKAKRIEEMEGELKALTLHNRMTSAKVVTSPDRLEAEVRDADERKENALKDLDSKRRELNAEQDKQRQWASTDRLVGALEECLQEVAAYEDKILSSQRRLGERERARSRTQEMLSGQRRVVASEAETASEREAAFEREREKHVAMLQDLREQIATVKSQANEMRRRLADVNKENAEVQREVGKLKDELASLNRRAEAEDKKMANRLRGVLDKLNEARRVYEAEMSEFEEAASMVAQSRLLDGQEHSDTVPLTNQRRSTLLTPKNLP